MTPFLDTTHVLYGMPRVYRTWRQETSAPFRRCDRALCVRIPWTKKAIVAGWWNRRLADEDEAFTAIGFHPTPYLEQEHVAQD